MGSTAAEVMGRPWAQAAGWLPVSPAGWQTNTNAAYRDFLNQQLALAVAHPAGEGYTQTATLLSKALREVLEKGVPPSEAVQAILSQR